jgi:hypothetical protein
MPFNQYWSMEILDESYRIKGAHIDPMNLKKYEEKMV